MAAGQEAHPNGDWHFVLLPDWALPRFALDLEAHSQTCQEQCRGEVYAFCEMIDHMALLREFYAPFSGAPQGMEGKKECDSLFSHLKNRTLLTGKYLVRHFLSIQQLIEDGDLDNVYWLPGVENPADGLTKLKSEMGPIPPLLETGRIQPGLLRPLKGLAPYAQNL